MKTINSQSCKFGSLKPIASFPKNHINILILLFLRIGFKKEIKKKEKNNLIYFTTTIGITVF
jgi:hypothetical protein